MKKQLLKKCAVGLIMSLTVTNVSAQRDRYYVKNQIKKWGTCKNVAITKTKGYVTINDKW